MEKRMRSEFEDIPELLQQIQSRLPVEDAARTSVLSKSWLQAWRTIPILRFFPAAPIYFSKDEERKQLEEAADRTLKRYLRDNIPIESIELMIDTTNQESANFLAENWIRPLAIKTCLQRLSLVIDVNSAYSFTLPAEILSGQNLTDIQISCLASFGSIHEMNHPLSITTTRPLINCVSLQRLRLKNVQITEEVLDAIFSICRSLVDVDLSGCTGFTTIKVQNLHRLHRFKLDSNRRFVVLEINHVPDIRLFTFKGNTTLPYNLASSLGGSVTELWLGGMSMDNAFFHNIITKSKFPFLESLTLDMKLSTVESFDITFADSLKSLSLVSCTHMLIGIKVYALKIVFFNFSGETMPSLLFSPTIVLEQIQIELSLPSMVDESFFLKMREAFTLSKKCDIKIDGIVPSDIDLDLDDLRRRVPFPATNVQRLSLTTFSDVELGLLSPIFFDALLLICHPEHVVDNHYLNNNNRFCKLLGLMMMTDYLKDVEIRRRGDEKWEPLRNSPSWTSLMEGGSADKWCRVEFKLYWQCSVE